MLSPPRHLAYHSARYHTVTGPRIHHPAAGSRRPSQALPHPEHIDHTRCAGHASHTERHLARIDRFGHMNHS